MNSALIILIDKSVNEDTAEFFDTSDTYFPGTKNNLQCIYTEYLMYTYIFIDLNSYQDEGSLEIENDKTSTVEIADHPVERSQMGNYVWCDIYISVVKGKYSFFQELLNIRNIYSVITFAGSFVNCKAESCYMHLTHTTFLMLIETI